MLHRAVCASVLATLLLWSAPTVQAGDETSYVIEVTGSLGRHPFTFPLDTAALTYQRGWRLGPDGRPVFGTSYANGPIADGAGLEVQARIANASSPFGVLLFWNNGRSARDATITTELQWSPNVENMRLTRRVDEQTNTATVRQAAFGLGFSYDMLHNTSHLVFAPGIGVQYWAVTLDQRSDYTSSKYRSPLVGDGPTIQEILRTDSDENRTSLGRFQGMLLLDCQLWTSDKKRTGIGIVAHGRYVIDRTQYNRPVTTLLETYHLPIRQAQWQARVGLAFGF